MKVIAEAECGPPGVLQLKVVEKPAPKDNEILVRVRATSVNALDFHAMRGLLISPSSRRR